MSTDPMIERALQEGARNQEVHGLIRNWCANARIEKFGGVGMLEQLTGYPIGHHSMACDFAALPGPATWDLAEAALAFHDNQCATCKHRKPAGFPNLSKLVAERDDRLAVLQASAAAAEMTAETARLERRAEREALRALLAPVSASLVDQLSALDEGPSPAATQALAETAKLAADTFEPAVIEHLFQLMERLEPWALDASLLALKQLRADPPRLARGAMVAMAQGLSVEAAATVIADLAADVNPESIGPALANLAALATRDEDFFLQDQPAPLPQALLSLHRRHAASVEAGLEHLLAQNAVWPATLAARGLLVIARESDEAAVRCARAVLSKLARGTGFSEYGEPGRELLYPLRDAAARAYLASPEATEALMQKFLLGASEAGYGRIFSVYGRVLGGPGRIEGPATDAADDVALRRVLRAIQGSPPDSALREIQSLLQARVGERGALAARHIDGLIGAAILLDDQLDRLDSAMNEPAKDALNAVTLGNRRSSVTYIQRHLVRWAASGAAGAPKATADYLDLLAGLPEDRERLRALLIGELDELAVSPETFGLVLPVLYGALVGASVSVRGAAARLVGKLGRQRRNDAPPLLMEAFVELLHDPFWYVIKAAVDALGRFSPPDAMKAEVGNMLYQLVRAYGEDRSRSEFIVECLDLLIHRHLTDAQLGGPLGHWVVEVLGHHAPETYARELPNLGRALGEIPEFGGLVLKALLEAEFHEDEIVRALRELAPQTVALNRQGFLEAALGAENLQAAGPFVETFSKVGDWEAAEQVAAAVAARQPSTIRARYRRVTAEMLRAAAAYERAIAEGRLHDLPECAQAWRDLRDELVGEQS